MKKTQKKFPLKKLPSNLKKAYTEKELEKKLLKKLYIPADRQFLAAQFVPDKKEPAKRRIIQAEYGAKDFTRLRSLGKQIRRQKGRFKLLPLAVAAIFSTAAVIFVLLFKDPLAKRGITMALQKLTGAKVDIAFVHVGLSDTCVSVHKLAVADKNSPMRNVFEVQKMELDFNLTQLLKRRFVCENLEVSGMTFATERKTSGELPSAAKREKKNRNKGAKEGKTLLLIKERQKHVAEQSKKIISSMFKSLNPQNILDDALKQLQTPSAAKTAQKLVEQMIFSWEKKPAEFENAVNDFKTNAEEVINRDYQAVRNITELRAALENIDGAIRDGKKLSAMTETMLNDLQNDSKTVQKAATQALAAVKKDTDFINGEINKIHSFTLTDGKNILAQTISAAAYSVLGKYYPCVEATLFAALNSNSQTKAKKPNKKRRTNGRMQGRTIEYRLMYPSFLIQQILANGTGFECRISDLSNDPDRWGKPAQFNAHFDEELFSAESKRTHDGNGIVNTGEKLNYPLLKMQYTGNGYKASFNPASALQIAEETSQLDIAGIPAFTGRAKVKAGIQAEKSGLFSVDADFDFDQVQLTAETFEPAFISRIYNKSLESVKNMRFQVKAELSQADLKMDVTTNADKIFIAALQKGINEELESIKQKTLEDARGELKKYTDPLNEKLVNFINIENGIKGQKQVFDMLQKQLKNRKTEINRLIEQAGKEVLNKATSQVKEKAADTVKDVTDGAFKELFGR